MKVDDQTATVYVKLFECSEEMSMKLRAPGLPQLYKYLLFEGSEGYEMSGGIEGLKGRTAYTPVYWSDVETVGGLEPWLKPL